MQDDDFWSFGMRWCFSLFFFRFFFSVWARSWWAVYRFVSVLLEYNQISFVFFGSFLFFFFFSPTKSNRSMWNIFLCCKHQRKSLVSLHLPPESLGRTNERTNDEPLVCQCFMFFSIPCQLVFQLRAWFQCICRFYPLTDVELFLESYAAGITTAKCNNHGNQHSVDKTALSIATV
ncbi:hypothetical protein V8F20_010136 [Naviculisporaceae sp. PSN 640]